MNIRARRASVPRTLAAILLSAASLAASAQSGTPLVTGTISGPMGPGVFEHVVFNCTGAPTCTGQYTESYKIDGCSNSLDFSGVITITGMNLAVTGSFEGLLTMGSWLYGIQAESDGSCRIVPPIEPATFPYRASWNAATGTGSITMGAGGLEVPGTFKANVSAPPPVFPMTVTSNIDAVSATAAASIQFRPQDVGSSGSVYVFAVAPSGVVKGGKAAGAMVVGEARSTTLAGEKAGECVVSQLNSAGQLVAVSFDQLRASVSGTLSAAGASVSILNATPTPNVAGSTFYVGYGPSSSAMVNDGVFRNAVLVPGSSVCPMLPSLTALWWNPGEPGWGLNLNHQSSTVFGTLFTYDAGRAPLWLVMSGGVMQPDGVTYTGDLYRTTGPAFNANPFTPIGPANLTRVGTMSVSFPDANVGTLTYTVNGMSVSKTVQRQVYGSRAANCLPASGSRAGLTNYQDLWWNPAESGWGLNVTHQDNTLFATLFTYDASGRDLWLVMSSGVRQPDGSYLGDLFRTNGPAFNALPFTGVSLDTVGTMQLRFIDGDRGTLTYTYNGAPVTKSIERQVFASPASACN